MVLKMNNATKTEDIKKFLLALTNAIRALRLYPAYNPIPAAATEQAFEIITEILNKKGSVFLKFSRTGINEGNEPVKCSDQERERLLRLSADFLDRGISSLMIFKDIKKDELLTLLNILNEDPARLRDMGGAGTVLKKENISHLKLNEIPEFVSFSETRPAEDITKASYTQEDRLMNLIASVILKDNHTGREIGLINHILSKPSDLRSVLTHIATSGGSKGEFQINLLERSVIKLRELIESKYNQLGGLEENLARTIVLLPADISQRLLVNLIFSSVRSAGARKLLNDISPEKTAEILLDAHDKNITRIERIGTIMPKIDIDSAVKDTLIRTMVEGLIERGYSQEEATLILTQQQEKPKTEEEGVVDVVSDIETYSSTQEDSGKEPPGISVESVIESSRDIKLLEALRSESAKYRSEEYVARALFSLIYYFDSEEKLESLNRNLELIMGSLAANGAFDVFTDAIPYLRRILENDDNQQRRELARKILNELSLKRYIYHAFECLSNNKPGTSKYNSAFKFLQVLPREKSIEGLIDILSTEELLSRRKLLLSILSKLGSDSINILGQRIQDSRWYLVRNIITIFAMIGDQKAVPYIKEALEHADFRVRKEAIRALGVIGGHEAYEILAEHYEREEGELKFIVLKSLGRTRDPESLRIIRPIVENRDFFFRDLEYKLAAIDALGKLATPEAIQLLERLKKTRSLIFPGRARKIARAARSALEVASAVRKEGVEDAPAD